MPPVTSSKPPVSAGSTHGQWKAGLIGFYLSCAGVALGATFAGGGHFLFRSTGWLVFGICLAVVSTITCFYSPAAARRSRGAPG